MGRFLSRNTYLSDKFPAPGAEREREIERERGCARIRALLAAPMVRPRLFPCVLSPPWCVCVVRVRDARRQAIA